MENIWLVAEVLRIGSLSFVCPYLCTVKREALFQTTAAVDLGTHSAC